MSKFATLKLHAEHHDLIVTAQSGTPAAVGALEALTVAYHPAIQSASTISDALDHADAYQVAAEAFIQAVRNYDADGETSFAATIAPILRRAVLRAARTDNVVTIPDAALARYWRLMHAHDMDATAAYAAASNVNGDGLSQAGFLAVHKVVSGVADVAAREDHELEAEADEAVIRSDYVQWLFTKVADVQESILRLRYGFEDVATLKLLAAWNDDDANVLLCAGDQLDDVQVSSVLAMPRSTVNRQARKALDAMRAADAEALAAEIAAAE